MGLAEWLVGYAGDWDGVSRIPAACSDSGTVTRVMYYTTQTAGLNVAVNTGGGTPYSDSPHAIYSPTSADGWVNRSFYDSWDGPNPLLVTAGQPLWLQLDSADMTTNFLYFAVLIDSFSSAPSSLAGGVGSALQTSGVRTVGFTG